MANSKSSKRKKKQKKHSIEIIICLFFAIIAGLFLREKGYFTGTFGKLSSIDELGEGKAYFHFIDVGQGDSTLITSGDHAVVIDTGSVSEADTVIDYINRYADGVDYLILTHPHEDHMGSAAQVLANVEVEHIIMPMPPPIPHISPVFSTLWRRKRSTSSRLSPGTFIWWEK